MKREKTDLEKMVFKMSKTDRGVTIIDLTNLLQNQYGVSEDRLVNFIKKMRQVREETKTYFEKQNEELNRTFGTKKDRP